jgi:hypothetical protein
MLIADYFCLSMGNDWYKPPNLWLLASMFWCVMHFDKHSLTSTSMWDHQRCVITALRVRSDSTWPAIRVPWIPRNYHPFSFWHLGQLWKVKAFSSDNLLGISFNFELRTLRGSHKQLYFALQVPPIFRANVFKQEIPAWCPLGAHVNAHRRHVGCHGGWSMGSGGGGRSEDV